MLCCGSTTPDLSEAGVFSPQCTVLLFWAAILSAREIRDKEASGNWGVGYREAPLLHWWDDLVHQHVA